MERILLLKEREFHMKKIKKKKKKSNWYLKGPTYIIYQAFTLNQCSGASGALMEHLTLSLERSDHDRLIRSRGLI